MIKCPNCGTMNEPGSSFCFQCGTDIRNVAASAPEAPQPPPGFPPSPAYPPPPSPSGFPSAPQPPGFPPPTSYPANQGYDPARQGWTPDYMTPPDEPKRRKWLWITLGLILGCILVCVIGTILVSTSDTVSDFVTSVSEFSTEEANNN